MSSDLCLTLPHTATIQQLRIQRTDGKLRTVLDEIFSPENTLSDPASCAAALQTLSDSLAGSGSALSGRGVLESVCGNYLLEILLELFDAQSKSAAESESSAMDDDAPSTSPSTAAAPALGLVYNKFFLILKLCPGAASHTDKDGLSLLHHLLLQYTAVHTHDDEHCDDFYRVLFMLSRAVFIAHPAQAVLTATTEHGPLTPLQILLRNPSNKPVDYELASMVLAHYPLCARVMDVNGRLPIHHVMTKLVHVSSPSAGAIALLKQLLACYPDGAFQVVKEEVRTLRINHVSGDEHAERTFSFQAQTVEWRPVDKASSERVKQVFAKFLDTLAKKQIKSQVRR